MRDLGMDTRRRSGLEQGGLGRVKRTRNREKFWERENVCVGCRRSL